MATTGKARHDAQRQQRHAAAFSFLTGISLQGGTTAPSTRAFVPGSAGGTIGYSSTSQPPSAGLTPLPQQQQQQQLQQQQQPIPQQQQQPQTPQQQQQQQQQQLYSVQQSDQSNPPSAGYLSATSPTGTPQPSDLSPGDGRHFVYPARVAAIAGEHGMHLRRHSEPGNAPGGSLVHGPANGSLRNVSDPAALGTLGADDSGSEGDALSPTSRGHATRADEQSWRSSIDGRALPSHVTGYGALASRDDRLSSPVVRHGSLDASSLRNALYNAERSSSPISHILTRSKENLLLERHNSLTLAEDIGDMHAAPATAQRGVVRLASMGKLSAAVSASASSASASSAQAVTALLGSRLYFAGWPSSGAAPGEGAPLSAPSSAGLSLGAPSSATALGLAPSTPGLPAAAGTFGSQVSSWGLAQSPFPPFLGESVALGRTNSLVASAPVWVCSFLPYRSASKRTAKGDTPGDTSLSAGPDATAATASTQPLLALSQTTGSVAFISSGKSKVKAVSYRQLLDGSSANEVVDDDDEPRPQAYDPHMLDDPEMRSGKHRTVMKLPSLTVSIIQYVRPSDLKRGLNEQFRERHPTIPLTFSKMRSLKLALLEIGVTQSGLELSTVAKSYVYFEKLILKGVVTKDNRKEVAAACLLLAAKFNDQLCYQLKSLFESVEHVFGVPKKSVIAYEFPVYVALEFTLHIDPAVIFPHLDRLFHLLPDYAEPLFTVQVQQKRDTLAATESSDDGVED